MAPFPRLQCYSLCFLLLAIFVLSAHADVDDPLVAYHQNLSQFLRSHVNVSLGRDNSRRRNLIFSVYVMPTHLDDDLEFKRTVYTSADIRVRWTEPRIVPWQPSEHPNGENKIDLFRPRYYGLRIPFSSSGGIKWFFQQPLRIYSNGLVEAFHQDNFKLNCYRQNSLPYPYEEMMCYTNLLRAPVNWTIKCNEFGAPLTPTSEGVECDQISGDAILLHLTQYRYHHGWEAKHASLASYKYGSRTSIYLLVTFMREVGYDYQLERSCAMVMGILCTGQYLMAARTNVRLFFNALALLVTLFWFHDMQNFKSIVYSSGTPNVVLLYFGVLVLQVFSLVWSALVHYLLYMSDMVVPDLVDTYVGALASRVFGPTAEQEHVERAQIMALNAQLFQHSASGAGINDDLLLVSPSVITTETGSVSSGPADKVDSQRRRVLKWSFITLIVDRLLCLCTLVIIIVLACFYG